MNDIVSYYTPDKDVSLTYFNNMYCSTEFGPDRLSMLFDYWIYICCVCLESRFNIILCQNLYAHCLLGPNTSI